MAVSRLTAPEAGSFLERWLANWFDTPLPLAENYLSRWDHGHFTPRYGANRALGTIQTEHEKIQLTGAHKQQYLDDGYIVVPGILNAEEVEDFKRRAREIALGDHPELKRLIVRDVRVAKGEVTVEDPERGLWKLLNPDRFDPLLRTFPAHPRLLDVCEGLIGPDIMSLLLMYIYKPPGVESVHNYHQDGYYFAFGPLDLALGVWVALDRTTAENGTLSVIRGSHKWGIKEHVRPEGEMVNAGILGVEGVDGHPDEVVLELDPGDGIFFDSRLLHGAGSNRTEGHRRVLTVHLASAKCKPTGENINYHRFRLVRGQRHEGCI